MKPLYFISTFITLLSSTFAFTQAGNLDPDFGGGDGLVNTSFFNNKQSQGDAVAVTAEGRILVSGYTAAPDGLEHATLSCFLPDGSPDNSFNGNGKLITSFPGLSSYSKALVIQPDGKIIMSTHIYNNQETKLGICRYNPDGSPDNTFDEDGIVNLTFSTLYLGSNVMALQPDGKIVVAGYYGNYNDTTNTLFIARFLEDGTPDDSFDGDGIATTLVGESYLNVYSLLIQPDGKIIIGGYAVLNGNDEFAALRFTTDGQLDQDFSDDGIAIITVSNGDDRAIDAVLQPDGKIVLGGYALNSTTGESEFAAVRLKSDGALDNSFHGDGIATVNLSSHSDAAYSILLQPDGKIILGGYAHSDTIGNSDMALVRLKENGVPDNTFDSDGVKIYTDDIYTSSLIRKIAFQPDGKIVGTGFVFNAGINSMRVARFISGLTVSVADDYMPVLDVSIFPNPASEQVNIEYELDRDETMSIHLCDIQGRIVQTLMSPAERSAGKHGERLTINQSLPPGNYFVNLETEHQVKSVKIVVD